MYWKDCLEEFLALKQAQGLCTRTIGDYRGIISRFFKECPADAFPDNCKRHLFEFMAKPAAPNYYNIKFTYLSSWFNWLLEEGVVQENPLRKLKKKKATLRYVHIENEVIKKLLALPDKHTFAGLRDYCLLLLQIDTGVRPSEAFRLILEDYNPHACEMYVRSASAKTRIARTLMLSPQTVKSINLLVENRHKAWEKDTPIFCTCTGCCMEISAWDKRMDQYSKQLGTKIRPYDLRHYFATVSLLNSPNVHALKTALGHADLTMATRYLHFTESDIRQWHQASTPLNALMPQVKLSRVNKIK